MAAFDAKAGLCDIAKKAIPEFRNGEWRYISCEQTDQERNFKNLLTWYSITYSRDGEQNVKDDIVAKVYKGREGRARLAFDALTRLWNAGMQPPSPNRVPRAYGFDPDTGVFFMQKAPGVVWREIMFRGASETRASSEQGASWLLQLHTSGVQLRKANPHAQVIRIERLTRDLSRLFPARSERLRGIAARQANALAKSEEFKPSHGDFHPRHLFMTDEVATGVDFDTMALREPAYDVGYAIGHILMMSWFRSGSFLLGEKAAGTFLERYKKGAVIDMERVSLHVGRAIYQSVHYGVVMRNPSFEGLHIEPWLDLVEYYLSPGADFRVPSKYEHSVAAKAS